MLRNSNIIISFPHQSAIYHIDRTVVYKHKHRGIEAEFGLKAWGWDMASAGAQAYNGVWWGTWSP